MRIEFKDDNSRPRRTGVNGVFEAEVVDISVMNKNEQQFIAVDFLTEVGKFRRLYPTAKGERWKFKIFLEAVGIEKDKKKNMYVFDTDEVIGKKVIITIKNGFVVKTQPYVDVQDTQEGSK